jgi:HEAT repeat protein
MDNYEICYTITPKALFHHVLLRRYMKKTIKWEFLIFTSIISIMFMSSPASSQAPSGSVRQKAAEKSDLKKPGAGGNKKEISKEKSKPVNEPEKETPGAKKDEKNVKKPDSVADPAKTTEDKDAEKELKKVENIAKTIEFGVQKDRRDAINSILKIKNKDNQKKLCEQLTNMLKDETDADVKIKAITILGELLVKEAVAELVRELDNDSEDVRIAAVYALKKIDDHSVTDKLILKLKEQDLSKNSNFTEALISTLGEFKAVQLLEFSKNSIKDHKTTKNLRVLLVIFLGKIGSIESKGLLTEILNDDDEEIEMRGYAAGALGALGIKESAGDIDGVLKKIESFPFKKKQQYYTLYIHCVAALSRLGDEKAFPRLMSAMRSDNSQVRLQAVKLIKDLKDKRTIDPSPKVQKAAKEALEAMGIKTDDGAVTPSGDEDESETPETEPLTKKKSKTKKP